MAALAPIPSASVRITVAARPFARASERRANRRSVRRFIIVLLRVSAWFLASGRRFEGADVFVEPIQPLLPEFAVMPDPVGDVLERRRLEPARTPLRVAAARDQAGAFENFQV